VKGRTKERSKVVHRSTGGEGVEGYSIKKKWSAEKGWEVEKRMGMDGI
jgi:hypothetical protein